MLRAENDGDSAGLARAHQYGGNAGLGQFGKDAGVEPGLRAMDDAAVDQLDGHGAPALAGFVQSQGFAFGFDFELGAVKQ